MRIASREQLWGFCQESGFELCNEYLIVEEIVSEQNYSYAAIRPERLCVGLVVQTMPHSSYKAGDHLLFCFGDSVAVGMSYYLIHEKTIRGILKRPKAIG